ncbi:MAG: histidine kinase [Dokdonella sp.]|nr:histidine kinase [Dokdonella sp.]MCW5568871.1 histidine kinase [Dokdonella sp.]
MEVTAQADNRAGHRWLPQFCSLPTLFAVMVVAELVVIVLALAPARPLRETFAQLGIATVFVQWLALLNVVVLCSMRDAFARWPARVGFIVAWLLAIVTTGLGSAVVHAMDEALGLRLLDGHGGLWRFALGNAAICALIAAALLRYLYVREQWRERVEAAAKAQVDALQARIRPHFLFNSMNTIASLIRTRPVEAERTVEDLSDLFRAALGAREGFSTLGEELDLVGHYLRIEGLRLGERLKVDSRVEALPRALALPPLLLQPLVENAVYHGIQRLPEGGTVAIEGINRGDAVEIIVRNPCPVEEATPGNAHALANVRARIGYHFGARGALLVEPSRGEFVVRVRLPVE